MRKIRIKGLNRRIFKRNLRQVLKKEYADLLKYPSTIEEWVDDYEIRYFTNGSYGEYEVNQFLTKTGYTELIRTY